MNYDEQILFFPRSSWIWIIIRLENNTKIEGLKSVMKKLFFKMEIKNQKLYS